MIHIMNNVSVTDAIGRVYSHSDYPLHHALSMMKMIRKTMTITKKSPISLINHSF